MNILHTVYVLRPDDTHYRSKLKTRIKKDFMDKIYFPQYHVAKNVLIRSVKYTVFSDRYLP